MGGGLRGGRMMGVDRGLSDPLETSGVVKWEECCFDCSRSVLLSQP